MTTKTPNKGNFYVLVGTGALSLLGAIYGAANGGDPSGVFFILLLGAGFIFAGFHVKEKDEQQIKETIQQEAYAKTHSHTLTISIPPSTKWQPAQAEQLISSLYSLQEPITLRIVATSSGITWQVVTLDKYLDTIKRSILASYPNTDIQETESDQPVLSKGTQIKGGHEFFVPLQYASDLKSLDPISGLVGAMSNLNQDERITYQLKIIPSKTNYNRIGASKLTKVDWAGLFSALGSMSSKRRTVVVREPNTNRFKGNLQRQFEEKVNSRLSLVEISVYVKSKDTNRRKNLSAGVLTAFSVYDHPEGNSIGYFQKGGHPLILNPSEAAALWHLPTEQIQTQGVVWSSGIKAPLPIQLIKDSGDLLLGSNTYQGVTRPVYLADPDRITHCNIVGRTRVGKTTFMHNLIHQDIQRGLGVGVIDPHGDLIQDILESSIPPDRESDVVLFDLADTDHPIPMNLLHVPRGVPSDAAVGLTIGVLRKIFEEQWSATRMEAALYSALSALTYRQNSTIQDIPKLFLDTEYRTQTLTLLNDPIEREFWDLDYNRLTERAQLEVARPIMYRISRFYRNPIIRAIVCQPDSLDLRQIMDSGKIFLASLAGSATQSEAPTIGAMLISQLQMAAMSRANIPAEKRRMFYLYVDEVQNFVTSSLSVMFSEAAKYSLSLTVANQFLSQLEGGTLDAILGNTGTTIMFRSGVKDATDLGKYIQPTFDSQALMELDRFQTVVKMQHGGQTLPAFSMVTPPPPEKPDDANETAQRIRQQSRDEYTAPKPTQTFTKELDPLPETTQDKEDWLEEFE